jgi:hypothetical protein
LGGRLGIKTRLSAAGSQANASGASQHATITVAALRSFMVEHPRDCDSVIVAPGVPPYKQALTADR